MALTEFEIAKHVSRKAIREAMEGARRSEVPCEIHIAPGLSVRYVGVGAEEISVARPARRNWKAELEATSRELREVRELLLALVRAHGSGDGEAYMTALDRARDALAPAMVA